MDIWETEAEDNDAVRAVKALLRLYARDYLRHSDAHAAVLRELGKETLHWLRRGSPDHGKPLLSSSELATRVALEGASTGTSRLHKILREIGENLASLGQPEYAIRELPRGEYDVNAHACTFLIDGQPTIVTLAGPAPEDRGERRRRGALFLQPRYEAAPPQLPAIIEVDLAPFASTTFRCLLEHPRGGIEDGRSTLRAVFGGLPLTLFGAGGSLSIIGSDDTEESYEEDLLAADKFEDEASEVAAGYGPWKRIYAEARLLDQEPLITLDGAVPLHPRIPAERVVPVLDTWPASLVRRIAFEFTFSDALLTELGGDESVEAIFDAAVDVLQSRGPILRNDPFIGLVGAIDAVAELGFFCMPRSLTVTFQRRGDGDLWRAVKNFPLNDVIAEVLRRKPPAGATDDASL